MKTSTKTYPKNVLRCRDGYAKSILCATQSHGRIRIFCMRVHRNTPLKYHSMAGRSTKSTSRALSPASSSFHTAIQRLLESHSLFKCTNLWRFHSSSVDRCGEVGFRLVNSIYYSYLVRWLQFLPKEQFLLLRTEDIDSKTHELMNQIAEFLGISPLSAIKANMFSHSRNQQRFASQEGFWLKEKTVALLQDFFKPHNTMLVELVGDRRFLWSD